MSLTRALAVSHSSIKFQLQLFQLKVCFRLSLFFLNLSINLFLFLEYTVDFGMDTGMLTAQEF